MPEWESEIEVGEELARALIAEQFPGLPVGSLRRVGEGWDNTVWATRDEIAFRFPRRAIAVPGVEREITILPQLAKHLPAPIPDAAYIGVPSPRFPWPWSGSRLIAGRELAFAGLDAVRRRTLASDLGEFLCCLHDLQPDGTETLEIDPMGRADMSVRVPRAREALKQARSMWEGGDRAEEILTRAERLQPDTDVVFTHGDLNLRHALVSKSGGLAGVIDWGDMCRASRSVDLALYWSVFDAEARAAFRSAYGPLGEETLIRSRALALFFDATLALYANDMGMAALETEALQALDRTLAD